MLYVIVDFNSFMNYKCVTVSNMTMLLHIFQIKKIPYYFYC